MRTVKEMQKFRDGFKSSIGFVPTMGALHAGHGSLLQQAKKENDVVILSIFVNPTQFNNAEDLVKYPKTWDKDVELAQAEGVAAIFFPDYNELYPDQYRYQVTEKEFSRVLCGAHRPGHFDGVLSVVMRLFNIVKPTRAYFGEKDFQQLLLIEGMVKAFFMDVEIRRGATVRESDGLAMSSRNLRLSPQERELAPKLKQILASSKTSAEASTKLAEAGFKVDYVEDREQRRFAAAFLGEVRLIDNVQL
ncbi:MAG: pantoate--beta-alanine ligase [Bdellovibrionota bacterium]